MEKKKDEEKINFEESMQKLETIVKELETGNVSLDEALEKFNEAYTLSKMCDKKLKEVTESVNKILDENGNLEDFKLEEK